MVSGVEGKLAEEGDVTGEKALKGLVAEGEAIVDVGVYECK